jgi:hypothetical protein
MTPSGFLDGLPGTASSKICQGILPPASHHQWMHCSPHTLGHVLAKACDLLWESEEDKQALAHASLVQLAESVIRGPHRLGAWTFHSRSLGMDVRLDVGKGLVPDPGFIQEHPTLPHTWRGQVFWNHLDDDSKVALAQEASTRLSHHPLDHQIVGAAWPLVIVQAVMSHGSPGWFTQFGEHHGEPVFVHLRVWPGRHSIVSAYPYH